MDQQTAVAETSKVTSFLNKLPKKQIAITTALVVATALTAKYVQARGLDVSVDA